MYRLRLILVLAGLLLMTQAPWRASGATATTGYVSLNFTGNSEVDLIISIADNFGTPDRSVKGELYRNGSLIQTFLGYAQRLYTDSGLASGMAFTYQFKYYEYDTNQQQWNLLGQNSVSTTTGQVGGTVSRDMTWSGGAWTCPVPNVGDQFPNLYVDQGVTLSIAPGTTVENCIFGSSYPDARGTIKVNGATLRGVTFPSNGNAYNGLTTLSIKNSTLLTFTADVAALSEFSGNSGSCSRPEQNYGGHIASRFTLPLDQIVVRDNQLPTCVFAAAYGGGGGRLTPNQVIVENNTLRGLLLIPIYDGYNGPAVYWRRGVSVVNNTFSETVTIVQVAGPLNVESNRIGHLELRDVLTATVGVNRTVRANTLLSVTYGIVLNNVFDTRLEGNTINCTGAFNSYGVWLNTPSSRNAIVANTISNCYEGIFLYAPDGLVSNNLVQGNTISAVGGGYGIELRFQVEKSKIEGNSITCAGGLSGLRLNSTTPNNNELVGNTVMNCYYGLDISFAMSNTIRTNTLVSNTYNVRVAFGAQNNTLYDNIFRKGPGSFGNADLSDCTRIACPNIWNTAKTPGANIVGGLFLGGNYWSDYSGPDADGDRLGDTPFVFNDVNVDNLPLIAVLGPDLIIPPFVLDPSRITYSAGNYSASNSAGKYIMPVDVVVANVGISDTTNVVVRFTDNGTLNTTQTIAELRAGASASLHLDWDISSILAAGKGKAMVQLNVLADPDNAISETSETNNARSQSRLVDVRPVIKKVEYDYFLGWFMAGVHVSNNFEASIDWNGDMAGLGEDQAQNVTFDLEGLQAVEIANNQSQVAHAFDMGYDMHEGKNNLRISAKNAANFSSDTTLLQMRQTVEPAWLYFAPGVQSVFHVERVFVPGPNNDVVIYRNTFKFPSEIIKGAVKADPRTAGPASGNFGPSIPAWELRFESHSNGRGRLSGTAGTVADLKGQSFQGAGRSSELTYGGGVEGLIQADAQDKWRLLELWAIIRGSGKVKGPKWPLPAAPIIYLQLSGQLDIEGRLGAVENRTTETIEFKPDILLRLEPGIEAAVVAGEKGLAWAEAALGGKARGDFQFLLSPFVRSALLRSYVRLAAGVLWFEKVQEWAWTWVLSSLNIQQPQVSLVAVQRHGDGQWQPIPRHTFRAANAPLLADQTPLPAETYPYANPAVTYLGNGRALAVWVHDDTSKPQHQGLDLYSALWNGTSWGTTISVTNDLIIDTQPSLAAIPGGALAVWTRLASVITGTVPVSPTPLYPQMEIAYATYSTASNNWSAPQYLTSNGVMDFLPSARSNLSKTMVLWLRDPDNNFPTLPTDAIPLGEDVYYAVRDGANWVISPTLALSNLKTAEQPQFLYNGRSALLVWSQDGDGDPTTVADTELMYSTWTTTTTTWSAPQPLTSNGVADLMPRLAYDSNGLAHLLWEQQVPDRDNTDDAVRSRLYHATFNGSAWSAPELVREEKSIGGLQLIGDDRNNLIAIWRAASDDLSDLQHSVYDSANRTWSEPSPLTRDRDMEWASDAVYDDLNKRVFTLLMKRQVLSETVAVEFPIVASKFSLAPAGVQLSETVTITVPVFGSSSITQLVFTPSADLAITTTDIALLPANPLPGGMALITATIRNVGDLAANPVRVAFYDGNPAAGGTLIGSVQSLSGALGGGLTATLSVNWAVPATPAIHNLFVKVDPQNEVAESNEQNNQAMRTAVLPDLVVAYGYATLADAQTILLTARISNTGGVVANNVAVEFRQGYITGTVIATRTLGILGAGQAQDVTVVWNLSSTLPATHMIWVVVDPANAIAEGDEDNNVGVFWADMLPDLTLAPSDIQGGSAVTITVHNNGLITATNVVVAVYRDALTGTLLYSGTIAVIAPNGVGTLTASLSPGTYTLYVEADPANAIAEMDESNNLATVSLSVSGAGTKLYLPIVTRN